MANLESNASVPNVSMPNFSMHDLIYARCLEKERANQIRETAILESPYGQRFMAPDKCLITCTMPVFQGLSGDYLMYYHVPWAEGLTTDQLVGQASPHICCDSAALGCIILPKDVLAGIHITTKLRWTGLDIWEIISERTPMQHYHVREMSE